jgi:HSP20 family protein
MAEVIINKIQKMDGLRGWAQGPTIVYERGVRRLRPASLFSLTLRDLLTASLSDVIRRFTEGMDWLFEGTNISPMTVWSPSIAISEKNEHIKVCAELPGLSQDDVWVELTQDGLTISGESKGEQDDRREGMYPWSHHSFMRTIPIPDEAQVENVIAMFENEILTVLVPILRSGHSHRLPARLWADLERAEALN